MRARSAHTPSRSSRGALSLTPSPSPSLTFPFIEVRVNIDKREREERLSREADRLFSILSESPPREGQEDHPVSPSPSYLTCACDLSAHVCVCDSTCVLRRQSVGPREPPHALHAEATRCTRTRVHRQALKSELTSRVSAKGAYTPTCAHTSHTPTH